MTMQPLPGTVEKPPARPSEWRNLWQQLTGPHASVQDISTRRQVEFAAAVALTLMLINIAAIVGILITRGGQFAPIEYPLLGLLVVLLISYGLIRSRNYRIGLSLQIWGFGAVGFFAIAAGSTNPASALEASLVPAYILASLLLPLWEMITLLVVSIVIIGLFGIPGLNASEIGSLIGILTTTGTLLAIGVAFRNALERQRLAELDAVNQELRLIQTTLEQRVEERTDELRTATFRAARHASQLQTIAELAHTISSISDLDALLRSVCRLISERFGFYHVGIFLNDEAKEYTVLQASNSEGGQRMLERGHRLKIGQTGIVGYVAQQGEARVALDVGTDAVFFDNPDLPETRSEMALPLMVGSRIIGVIDVQSTEPAAFSDEDLDVMRTLADQVAIAIENARLFSETRRALQEAEIVYNRFVAREWNRIALERQQVGYRATPSGIQPLEEALDDPEVQIAFRSGKPAVGSAGQPTLAVPLRVRGETIGVLHVKSPNARQTWSPDELEAVQRVAERAALALESARLLAESEKRAQREQVIGKVSNRIRQTLDLDTVLKTAAEELRQALNLQAAEVRLGLTTTETKARKRPAARNSS
jgi:GAF domain-containing protein